MTDTDALPPIVSRAEWETARAELLVLEKDLIRAKDAVSAARRRLPMVEIDTPYVFDTETGPLTLLDLFDGRRQLIVQHFMFAPEWDEGCAGCSIATRRPPSAHCWGCCWAQSSASGPSPSPFRRNLAISSTA
mgnify:CR=1 FL=1